MKATKWVKVIGVVIMFLVLAAYNKAIAVSILIIFLLGMLYPKIMVILGNVNYSNGKLDKSEKYLRWAYRCIYANAKNKIPYSYILMINGKFDKAEEVLDKISSKKLNGNELVSLRLNLSLVYWKTDRLDNAIEILHKTYKEYKTSIVYQNLGFFLMMKGDYKKALNLNLEAHDYDSENLGIMDNLAENYYFLGEYEKASRIFDKILQKKPTFASPYYYYALTLIKMGNNNKALKLLKKGLECKFNSMSEIKKEQIEEKIYEIEE